ncbi:MAG: DbpA RNA binding domain-containing protein, partial [Gammaproteobacteria bacterium]|nr:DbpA RNA binding domain-containing protein [Gammaproteobacteria bacterium]
YRQEHDVPALEIAAALARLSLGDRQLLLEPDRKPSVNNPAQLRDRQQREARPAPQRQQRPTKSARRSGKKLPDDMQRYRIEVGEVHAVKPGNIVGAIANEAGLDARYIGQIEIHDRYSLVDLPPGMPKEIFHDLQRVWVCGQQLRISKVGREGGDGDRSKGRKGG